MKKVLISISAKWCKLIFRGEKTIEVRKSFPRQLETPFEVLVYLPKKDCPVNIGCGGTVIGSFVCDKIEKIEFQAQCSSTLSARWTFNRIAKQACLTAVDMIAYLNGDNGYGWHITAPKRYDTPKELSEFGRYETKLKIDVKGIETIIERHKKFIPLTRPPQSWMYVEEI